MKLKFIPLLCLFTALAFILPSCSKDDDPDPKTNTELLAQGSWKFSAATVGGIDASGGIAACQRDNILTFAAVGSGVVAEGATKCDPADPDNEAFGWTFASNETELMITADIFTGGSGTMTIVSLTESQLVVSQNIEVLGTPQTAIITFIH